MRSSRGAWKAVAFELYCSFCWRWGGPCGCAVGKPASSVLWAETLVPMAEWERLEVREPVTRLQQLSSGEALRV